MSTQHPETVVANFEFPEGSLLSKVEIRAMRDGGTYEATIPIGLIDHEEVPVEAGHVRELQESMLAIREESGGSGQLIPVLVCEVPGKEKLLIGDGFHRDAAMVGLNADPSNSYRQETIDAIIVPNCTMDKVRDLRILTANIHSSLSFARQVEWITESWQDTSWSDKINADQAFNLAVSGSSGIGFGLSREEATDITAWVRAKSFMWKMNAGTIYKNLATASISDPDLVASVRPRKGGDSLPALTAQHLGVISKAYPKNYAEQRFIAGITTDHNLTVYQTAVLVELLAKAQDEEDSARIVAGIDFANFAPTPTRKPQASRKVVANSAINFELARQLVVGEVDVAQKGLEIMVLRGKFRVPRLEDVFDGNESRLVVLTEDDPDITELLSTEGKGLSDKLLSDRLIALRPRFLELFGTKYRIDQDQSEIILDTATSRIRESAQNGALKYVTMDRPHYLDMLLVATANDERVALSEGLDLSEAADETDPSSPASFSLDKVVKAFPGTSKIAKKVIAMHGIMELDTHAMAQLLGMDKSKVVSNIGAAIFTLNKKPK